MLALEEYLLDDNRGAGGRVSKKMKMFLVTAAMTAGMVFPAVPASASTCEVANPEIDAVVCGTYFKVMRVVCGPLEKIGGGCM